MNRKKRAKNDEKSFNLPEISTGIKTNPHIHPSLIKKRNRTTTNEQLKSNIIMKRTTKSYAQRTKKNLTKLKDFLCK